MVYEIRNIVNGKRYIGSTVTPDRRKTVHFRKLRQGKHHSIVLQRAFDKYGEKSFLFLIIEDNILQSQLIEREQVWLENLQPQYNVAKVAGSRVGVPASEETKIKMSISNKGRVFSPEHRAKIGAAHKGKKRVFTPEWRKNLSIAQIGRKHTDETRSKITATKMGNIPTTRKPVIQINSDTGEIIKTWASILQAAKELKISHSSISSVANFKNNGKHRTAGGFKWRFL